MDNKAQKILAAMDVSDGGILTGKEKFSDIQRVKAILPDHYEVKESKSPNAIHCISKIGIRKDGDAEDDEHWGYIMAAFKKNFGDRFKEVNHNVCFCHTDFVIYLKFETPTPTYNPREDYGRAM